jgi:uncharacterized membrane protein
MARDNRGRRGAMLVFATLLVVFSLAVMGTGPAVAYYYDTDGDGLADFFEIRHGLHGDISDEGEDWDGDGLTDIAEDANANGIVDIGETDPYYWDTDGDGISDGIEGLVDDGDDVDSLINALDLDSDGDWIPDSVEEQIQAGDTVRDGVFEGFGSNETDWLNPDTDGDGLMDGLEAMWGTDPHDANSDDDAWTDSEEIAYGTDPLSNDTDQDGRFDGDGNEDETDADGDGMINALDADSDNDGLIDGDEDSNENGTVDTAETDPTMYDTDGDGFSDGYEIYERDSDPLDGGGDVDGDGWTNGQEIVVWKTNPYLPDGADTDGDGLGDAVENPQGDPGRDTDGDGLIDALDLDSDNDGIDDAEEIIAGVDGYVTDPLVVDTDGDNLNDGLEVGLLGTDPTDPNDPGDGDLVSSYNELYLYETSFDMDDTDEDGVVEGTVVGSDRVGANTDAARPIPFMDKLVDALDVDSDGDGLLDGEEATYGTDMNDPDDDGDGLVDGEEVHIWGTDPAVADTDDDGLDDWDEIWTHWTDPLNDNTDGDFVDDGVELNIWLSDPLDPDSDGDGILDGETINGTYIDAAGVEQAWSFVENLDDVELGGDDLPNVLDPDSDWREWENPPTFVYLDFHDRTEIAYQSYVEAPFHVGPLNPGNPDTDGDGFPDAQEVACGFDPLDARDGGTCSYTPDDTDTDGLFDLEEAVLEGTTPPTMHLTDDFDGDGLHDGDEIHPSWWDDDGIPQTLPTSPMHAESEDQYFTARINDGIDDGAELAIGTNPHILDSDGDGINDGPDNTFYDALDIDYDSDGLPDGFEDVANIGVADAGETDADDADTDDDGIMDGDELTLGTDPLDPDTDGDTIMDGWEVGYTAGTVGGDTNPIAFGVGDADPTTTTNPLLADSDWDGLDDSFEDANGDGALDVGELDPADRDTDNDRLPDFYEGVGNDPTVAPADYYAADWVDHSLDPTFPFDSDSDNDGLTDDVDFEQKADPNDNDTDGDGLLDGDEIAWGTDPTNPDTDSDGCDETESIVSDIEAVDVDSDGDGIANAMDVDSDNDWGWDGAGNEDCAGLNDADADGVPNILDSDTDNDLLSDRQEMGLDTWHVFSDNDRDFDEDGILDGAEYYHAVHQPHLGEPDFEASDPKLFDTDGDGLHDGFEAGMVGPIPVHPVYGGTLPNPGVWDDDGSSNSNPHLADTDYDGISDWDEDANRDGDDGDLGLTETDPRDDDTDDDGLIDGYEVWATFNALLCDTDVDDLADGLEMGLQAAMGLGTDPVNPCLSERYDVVDLGAYTTDPLDDDTDGDTVLDGLEDHRGADVLDPSDGAFNGNNPYDTVSDWGVIGESDPTAYDTDRGGVHDGLDTDPVLFATGDWDIDFNPNGWDAAGDTLNMRAGGGGPESRGGWGGVLPGTSSMANFQIAHTLGGLNPDATDGPSVAGAILDSVYFRATSLHWAGPAWTEDYDAPEDTTHWIHYSAITFDPPFILNFAAGTTQVVDVNIDVPPGAMPGWYFGYVQAETHRGEPQESNMPQELPDDYIVFRLFVDPLKDVDICDNDGDLLGVGASDPPDFPEPAADGEMHLVGAPMYPGMTSGMFRVANPNTEIDGIWPPGADGVNDLNFQPALPVAGRPWDLDPPDLQGNTNLADGDAEILAVFEWSAVGPVDPTSAITFDGPLLSFFALGSVDSFSVNINTTTLPPGTYEGVVRVFEDDHGVDPMDPPDGVYQMDEVYDTFTLKFVLALPDLDIYDNYANMSGNQLEINVDPGDIEVSIGEIELWNASAMVPGSNVDAVDGPGTETILDFQYFDPTTGTLTKIPTDGIEDPISIMLYNPSTLNSIEIWLDGLMGDVLPQGQAKRLRLRVAEVPEDLPAGIYRTNHPVDWVPGDGTIPICARGFSTGRGWLPGEDGPGVVYDPDVEGIETLMDYFHLTVTVGSAAGIQFVEDEWSEAGAPGVELCDDITVTNIGNDEVDDVHFEVTNLIGDTYGGFLPSAIVNFDPSSIVVPLGETETTEVCASIPLETRADTYGGTISLLAEGEVLFDEMDLVLEVLPVYAMNVLDNGYNVIGNVMNRTPPPGGSAVGQFAVENKGNADLTDVTALAVAGVPSGMAVVVVIPEEIDWNDEEVGTVTVTWNDPALESGFYDFDIVIEADDGALSDSFVLTVFISELGAVRFVGDPEPVVGVAGERVDVPIDVENIGNADITEGITFLADDLTGGTGAMIPSGAIVFDPPTDAIGLGDSETFMIRITVPEGLLGQDYSGPVYVYLNGELQDEATVSVTLERATDEVTLYPNPFRADRHYGGVTIALGDVSEDAAINVYDMFGGLVAGLDVVTDDRDGNKKAEWDLENDDGKSVASGMYIVTIDTGDEIITRKIMVIR